MNFICFFLLFSVWLLENLELHMWLLSSKVSKISNCRMLLPPLNGGKIRKQ